MRVLVACEFSGVVRDAFAARGHDAWSCDLLLCERGGKHLQRDVRMIAGFRCLSNGGKPDYTQTEIAEALYSGRGECADLIRNAMAWFALEEVARELNPEL